MKKYLLIFLTVSCFGQFNPTTWHNLSGNYKVNTYIGGVSGTINTPALLAAKLGINVGRIKKFSVIGSDIECAILGNYEIPSAAFSLDTSITYYNDTEGKVSKIHYSIFNGCSSLVSVSFPSATSVGTGTYAAAGPFNGCSAIVSINIPKVTVFLDSFAYNYAFYNIKTGCVININAFLQTNPDPNLTYAINSRAAIVNYIP